jgi:hypothetical protein
MSATRFRLMLASLLGLAFIQPGHAQGLQSGTGMMPSRTLAMPPGTPAIDQPGALRRSIAHKKAMARASASKPAATPR